MLCLNPCQLRQSRISPKGIWCRIKKGEKKDRGCADYSLTHFLSWMNFYQTSFLVKFNCSFLNFHYLAFEMVEAWLTAAKHFIYYWWHLISFCHNLVAKEPGRIFTTLEGVVQIFNSNEAMKESCLCQLTWHLKEADIHNPQTIHTTIAVIFPLFFVFILLVTVRYLLRPRYQLIMSS